MSACASANAMRGGSLLSATLCRRSSRPLRMKRPSSARPEAPCGSDGSGSTSSSSAWIVRLPGA
jgi:hypothetical protein